MAETLRDLVPDLSTFSHEQRQQLADEAVAARRNWADYSETKPWVVALATAMAVRGRARTFRVDRGEPEFAPDPYRSDEAEGAA